MSLTVMEVSVDERNSPTTPTNNYSPLTFNLLLLFFSPSLTLPSLSFKFIGWFFYKVRVKLTEKWGPHCCRCQACLCHQYSPFVLWLGVRQQGFMFEGKRVRDVHRGNN